MVENTKRSDLDRKSPLVDITEEHTSEIHKNKWLP